MSRQAVEKFKRGVDLPQSKLTDEDIRLMRALSDDGVSAAAIGRKFEVSRKCAWNVVNYATWRHVA